MISTEMMKYSAAKGQPSQSSIFNEPQKPPILNSVTEDEDDNNYAPEEEIYGVQSYLRRYETMMRRQDDEHVATLSHLLPMLELLENLSQGHDTVIRNADYVNDTTRLVKEFHYSDFINILSVIKDDNSYDFIKTDRQWMMVLKMLTENVPEGDKWISWAEIVQCYKTCIVSMQMLENIPTPKHIRKRARERSLSMMSLFRPSNKDTIRKATEATSPVESEVLTTERRLPESKIETTGKQMNESTSRMLQLIFAFFLGAFLMAVSMARIPSPSNEPSILHKQQGRSIADFRATLIVPGPIAAPFPHNLSSPRPLRSTSRVVPASVSQSTTAPSLAPSLPGVPPPPTNTVRPIMQILAQAPFLKMHRNVQKAFKKTGSAMFPTTAKDRSEERGPFSDDSMAMAAVVGGTAAVGVVIPVLCGISAMLPTSLTSLLPVGLTVIAATLVAHGIRDMVASFFRRSKKGHPWRI